MQPTIAPSRTAPDLTRARRRPATPAVATAVLVAVVASGLALAALVPVAPLGAQAAAPAATLDWLEAELVDRGGTLPGPVGDATDWGLTADVSLTLVLGGRDGAGPALDAATALRGALRDYTTWDGIDPSLTGVRLAGPLAKTLLVTRTAGLDDRDVDGVDLEAELRSLQLRSGTDAGRFADRNPHAADSSTVFTQATALLALSRTAEGVPAGAAAFLAAQQCPDGGFRLAVGPCADGESDTDVTALALQALQVAPPDDTADGALARGLGWLLAAQRPDGSFGGSGPTAVANANSTGLAAQTLRLLGQPGAADRAARWITDAVLLGDDAVGTPAAADRGAIAYVPERRAGALRDGIPSAQRDQWRRSGAQAVLALGLPGAGAPVDADPVVPSLPPTTVTPTTVSPTTVTPTPSTVATTGGPAAAGPGTGPAPPASPGAPPPATAVADGSTAPGDDRAATTGAAVASTGPARPSGAEVAGAATAPASSRAGATAGALARTGSPTTTAVGVALVLIGVGAMAHAGTRPGRRRAARAAGARR